MTYATTTVVALAVVILTLGTVAPAPLITATAAAAPDSPTASPGTLEVSITDGSGTANATYAVNRTSDTINVTNGSVTDESVASVTTTTTAEAIQFAVDNATTENDTVVVGPGTYNGSLNIGQSVTLEGPNVGFAGGNSARGTEATISTDAGDRLVIEASNVEINGFNFEFDERAIQSKSGDDNLITNNRFTLTGTTSDTYAVRVGGGSPGTDVTNNSFSDITSNDGTSGDNVNGVVVTDPRGTNVANNTFSSVDTAVNVGDQDPTAGTVTVENNEFSDVTQFGAVVLNNDDTGLDADINNNTIESSQTGVFVFAGDSGATFSVRDNDFRSFDASEDDVFVDDQAGVLTLSTVLNANSFDTDVLDSSTELRPSPVTDVTLSNPSGRRLNLSLATSGSVSGIDVDLGGDTEGTGTDVTGGEFTNRTTGSTVTHTATVVANVSDGSSDTYQIDITAIDGASGTDRLPTSRQRVVVVQGFDGGSATVDPQATNVSSVTVTPDSGTGTTLNVSNPGGVPATGDQNKTALVSDVGVVDTGDAVVTALDINAGGVSSATIQFTVDKGAVSNDPTDLLVARFDDGSYQSLQTAVVESAGSTITIEAQTPGTSPFVVVETDADPADPESSDDDGGDSGDDGSATRGVIAVGEDSVTHRVPLGPVAEVTVEFDQPTTGGVRIESVGGFPTEAPTPEGQTVATVAIAPPSDVARLPGSIEMTIARSAVTDAGVDPAALRLVRYDEQSGGFETLETDLVSVTDQSVVVSAETPRFSVFGVVATDQETSTTTATATPAPTATPTPTSTATPTPTPVPVSTSTPTEGGGPGFGAVVAVAALLAAALLGVRRD